MDEGDAADVNTPDDQNGEWADQRQPDQELLERLLQDPFFSQQAPKSTGREYFNLRWLEKFAQLDKIDPVTLQATLAQLTADTVAHQLRRGLPDCVRVLVCGGGAHNSGLLRRLRQRLESWPQTPTVELTDLHGVSADWMEAILFASLAKAAVDGTATDLQAVTGAPAHVYGVVYTV